MLSSAASISLGKEASIRIVPALRNFRCSREPNDASSLPQPGTSDGFALGTAVLAGERLLLHGVLGLTAAPSDCLPAPPKKTPVLLFGAREVSLRGTQELDRIVVLSQGTATLAGTCTAGPPHRCSTELTPLFFGDSKNAGSPLEHNALCSSLEAFASARVASQLQETTEAGELQVPSDKLKEPQRNCDGLSVTKEALFNSTRPPARAGGVKLSSSARPSDMPEFLFLPPGPNKEQLGSDTWVQRVLRNVSLLASRQAPGENSGFALLSCSCRRSSTCLWSIQNCYQTFFLKAAQKKGKYQRSHVCVRHRTVSQALRDHRPHNDLKRKKRSFAGILLPLEMSLKQGVLQRTLETHEFEGRPWPLSFQGQTQQFMRVQLR